MPTVYLLIYHTQDLHTCDRNKQANTRLAAAIVCSNSPTVALDFHFYLPSLPFSILAACVVAGKKKIIIT